MVGYLPGLDAVRPAVPTSSTTVPRYPPMSPVAAEKQEEEKSLCTCIFGFIFFCALVGSFTLVIIWIPTTIPQSPRYSVPIDSVSGLDPTTDLLQPVLNPAFNLTFRVTYGSHHDNTCIEPGTYLELTYRCVKLATTAQHRLCAGPREPAEQKLVARATGVHVPGTLLDSLAADMRQGELVFQVTIRQSGGNYANDMFVASCGGRRVGAAAADLGTWCDACHLCP